MKIKLCKHQTVGWWIKQLKQYPTHMPVVLAGGPTTPFQHFISDSVIVKETKKTSQPVLCIDIGP